MWPARSSSAAPALPGRHAPAPEGPRFLSRDLYGFIPAACIDEFPGGPVFPRRFHCICSGRVAALAGPLSLLPPMRGRVRNALGRLRTWQLVLETVMRRAPVLPARFGARLPGRAATRLVMQENEERLIRAIEACGHLLEARIRVSGPRVGPRSGTRILAAREHIRLELKSFCLAVREEPVHPGGAILSLTVLMRPWDEPRLDAALTRLDSAFGGWLRFTCIGPLPPCSFVRVSPLRSASAPSGWGLTLTSTLPNSAWPAVLPRSREAAMVTPQRVALGQTA